MNNMEQMLSKYINEVSFKEYFCIPNNCNVILKPLASGEYNINYIFSHPITLKKYVLRLNTASQMSLDNQIEYEYKALKLLEKTGRTPKVFYLDDSKKKLPFGMLVMEHLEGRKLDYDRDIKKAAGIFADIHSCSTDGADFLVRPDNLLLAMLNECKAMASFYLSSVIGSALTKSKIVRLLNRTEEFLAKAKNEVDEYKIINTEVNSGNFIINDVSNDRCHKEGSYLIDWEKPILGEAAQDLAHFIAPTTTFWKTDKILKAEEQSSFIAHYKEFVDGRIYTDNIEDRVRLYLPLTCLRGLTWCAMAWVQYNDPNKLIRNEDTFNKIKDYLSEDFIIMLEERYFK